MHNRQTIRWGILGTSPISATIANAIHASTSASLVAIGSRNLDRSRDFAQRWDIPHYCLSDDLLDRHDIDAIYIGLPNHVHKTWILRSARAGKAVLCEKPLVLDPDEMHEVQNALQSSPILCMEGLMYRYHPFISFLDQLIQMGVIGTITQYDAAYSANIAHLANPVAGGAIRNLGCYPVSLIRLLARAEPQIKQASGTWDDDLNSDHQASVSLQFENGIEAIIRTSDNEEKHWHCNIHGTDGDIILKTNPWMPEAISQLCVVKEGVETIHTINADKPLYTYQIDVMNHHLQQYGHTSIQTGDTLAHSLGNVTLLHRWREAIKAKLQLEVSPPNTKVSMC